MSHEGRTGAGHLLLCQDREVTEKLPPCISERGSFSLLTVMFPSRWGTTGQAGGWDTNIPFRGLVSKFRDQTANTISS